MGNRLNFGRIHIIIYTCIMIHKSLFSHSIHPSRDLRSMWPAQRVSGAQGSPSSSSFSPFIPTSSRFASTSECEEDQRSPQNPSRLQSMRALLSPYDLMIP